MKRNLINVIRSMGYAAGTSLLTLTLMTGCISDDLPACPQDAVLPGLQPAGDEMPDEGKIFLQLKVYLADTADTRSATESDGTSDENPDHETGKQNENTVDKAFLYFYEDAKDVSTDTRDYDPFLCMFQVMKVTGNVDTYTLRTQVKPEELKSLAGKKVKLYLAANYTNHIFPTDQNGTGLQRAWEPLGAYFNFNGINADPLGYFGTGTTGKLMPLANDEVFRLDLTSLQGSTDEEILESLKDLLGFGNRTLDLSRQKEAEGETTDGTLVLERCVARVDFKPAAGKDKDGRTPLRDNIYGVGRINNLYAKMESMQVFNVQKNSNLFRQTSPGNDNGATYDETKNSYGYNLLGREKGNVADAYNWIAGRAQDWNWKREWTASTYNGASPGYTDYFYNQPLKATGEPIYRIPDERGTALAFITIDDLKEGTATDGYYPWYYISENTPPSTAAMTKGLSTGIVFRMTLCDKDGNPLRDNNFMSQSDYDSEMDDLQDRLAAYNAALEELLSEEPIDQTRYLELMQAIHVTEDAITELEKFVVGEITQHGATDYYKLTIGNDECYARALRDENSEICGYEVEYYYFFRHNLSRTHSLGKEDPMQYAVVRNNIYKISVTALNALPVPFDPKEPAEPQQHYMSVDLKILAWTKRDINVGF